MPTVAAEVSIKKVELADLYELRARQTLEGVCAKDIESASLQQKAISSGVFIDKARLLRGESTQNIAYIEVLIDCARMIRERNDQDSEEDSRQWREQHTITAVPVPPVPQPEPVTPGPMGAGYAPAESRPASQPQTQTQQPAVRVTYRTPVDPVREEVDENVLLHGLPHS